MGWVSWWVGVVLFWQPLHSLVRQCAFTSQEQRSKTRWIRLPELLHFNQDHRVFDQFRITNMGYSSRVYPSFLLGEGNLTNTQQGCWEDADSLLVLLDYMKICINAMHFIVQDVSNHTSLSTYRMVKKTPNISIASFPLFLSSLWHSGYSTVDSSWTATRRSQLRKWHKGAAPRWFGKAHWDHCWSAIRRTYHETFYLLSSRISRL